MNVQPSQEASAIERTIENAIRDAERAIQAAAQATDAAATPSAQDQVQSQSAPGTAAVPGVPSQGTALTFRVENNKLVIDGVSSSGVTTSQMIDPAALIPPQVPQMILTVVLGLIGMILAIPIGRAIGRYIDRRPAKDSAATSNIAHRLGSIEQALDAVAIEVERMSEANRYTTRLLTERVSAPDMSVGTSRQPEPLERTSPIVAAPNAVRR